MQTKIEPTHHQIAELLIDERISDMTQYLMEDFEYTLEEALDIDMYVNTNTCAINLQSINHFNRRDGSLIDKVNQRTVPVIDDYREILFTRLEMSYLCIVI